MRVLVGDIGGTKTGLGIAEVQGNSVKLDLHRRYPSRKSVSLGEIVTTFFDETGGQCEMAAFAVAGPVVSGRSKTTNLPWQIDAAALQKSLGFNRVGLLNDLEAVAWGVPALTADELAVLQPGATGAVGNACVVAAGTGLGEAGMFWDGVKHRAFATEGGHTDFAPTDDREFALLNHLQKRVGRVSWERVVSGMGIGNIYEFLAQWHKAVHPPAVAEALRSDGDIAAAVAEAASNGHSISQEAMELFAVLYGREAGNTALKHMALGGVYLGGGIAPKNLALLQGPGFAEGFRDKGRMRGLMEQIPVHVILDPLTPLYGAARYMVAEIC
ncbi:MAG: glucokinase [Lamprobacter sp.]|uniref:glucokinase n=1 Tax=Lamprobacter sp. TaxID=3100796 RepID=UPI002B261324|nr:glucokinase [Lamprobacter sp.]MEA3641262.1 glucokinase [Lamprobacter sp.]